MAWTSYGPGPDTGEQQGEIYNAIVSVSQQSKVDARLILATIIQEVSTLGFNKWIRVLILIL